MRNFEIVYCTVFISHAQLEARSCGDIAFEITESQKMHHHILIILLSNLNHFSEFFRH